MTTRAVVLLARDISLQFYIQPFIAVGEYNNTAFKSLVAPSTYSFTPFYDVGFNPNFNSRSLRRNLVFRWEYRPGSTVYLVWSQSHNAFSNDPKSRPFRSVGSTFSDYGTNIFMVKVNCFLI